MSVDGGTIGVNILGGGFSNEGLAAYIIQDLKPRSVVVINEEKLAAMLVRHVERVLFRMKDTSGIKDDDSAYGKHDPVVFIDALHALAPAGCWLYAGNEFGSSNLAAQDEWNYQAAIHAHKLGRKIGIQAQYTQHFLQGEAGWASQRRSIEIADAVLPHCYYMESIEFELQRRPRHGFMVLDEIRSVYGDALPIIVTEFGYAHEDNPRRGFEGILSEDRYAEDTEKAARYCQERGADLLVYLMAQPGTEWETFNVREKERYKQRIATFNRRSPVTQTPTVNWSDNVGQGEQYRILKVDGSTTTPIRVRADGGTSFADVGRFVVGDVITIYDGDVKTDARYTWKRAQRESDGLKGWIAVNLLTLEALEVEPVDPHPPISVPLPEWDPSGRVSRAELAAWFRAMADLVEFGIVQTS